MKTTRFFLSLLVGVMCLQSSSYAVGALGYNNNRIACSADGNNQPDLEYTGTYNTADPDDWGATPMALAILAKAKLQDKLVHYSYNNFMPSPPHTTEINYMKRNADDAITRFQFDSAVFFDVGTQKEEAIASLCHELMISTAADPLYFMHMGPSEFFYQAVQAAIDSGAIESLSYVYVVSHSNYNDNQLRRDTEHTMTQCIALSGDRINYKLIKDQNTCDIGYKGLCSNTNAYPWRNFKDHRDSNVQWLYLRMQDHKHGKYDVSDAGLVYYLLMNNEAASPSLLDNFFDFGILLPGEELIEKVNITDDMVTLFPQRRYQLVHEFTPAMPWDDFYTWSTDNAAVAYVSPTGKVVGVAPGTATITLKAGLSDISDQVTVNVAAVANCTTCTMPCDLVEKDGLFVFEAERFQLKGQWEVVSGDNYASGGKYITYTGANSYNAPNAANEISYTFTVTNPGAYTLKWFMRQPDEAEGDLSNDVWIYIDGDYGYANGTQQLTDFKKFVGRSKTVFTMNGQLDMDHSSYSLKANFPAVGDYTIKLSGRSEHIQIDKFVLYKNTVTSPVVEASNVCETTTCMDDVVAGDFPFVALQGISLAHDTLNMALGDSVVADVVYTPATASNSFVTLESNDVNIAAIDGQTIIAKAAGTTRVMVTSIDKQQQASYYVKVTGSAALEAPMLSDMRIFPNPIGDNFNLVTAQAGVLEIVSMEGRVVHTAAVAKGTNTIQLTNPKAGHYIARLCLEDGVVNQFISVYGK